MLNATPTPLSEVRQAIKLFNKECEARALELVSLLKAVPANRSTEWAITRLQSGETGLFLEEIIIHAEKVLNQQR
jgi:hypothetical protein